MKNSGSQRDLFLSRAGIFLLVAMLGIFPSLSLGAVSPPNLVTYQGRLLDSNGTPVSASSVSIIFELYNASSGGTCVWSNSSASCVPPATARTITLTDGLFSENLGDTGASPAYSAIGDTIFGDNATLYLQVTVEGEPLSPRKQLTASPYALNSETLDGLDSTDFLSNVGDTGTGDYDFTGGIFFGASPLVFEGTTNDDFQTIFALPNPTAVDNTITFQDGSGTLAFTSDILWVIGTNGTVEDGASVIVGSDLAFTYVTTAGASDLRVGDDFEVVDDGFFGGDLVVGASTSPTETLANIGFSLNGDDLFVAGTLGVDGDLYTDGTIFTSGAGITATNSFDLSISDNAGGAFYLLEGSNVYLGIDTLDGFESITLGNSTTNPDVSIVGSGTFDVEGHMAVGGSASVSTSAVVLLSESLSCASGCQGISTSITNTAGPIALDASGGLFRISSPLGTSSGINMVGINGGAVVTGAVSFAGPVIGAYGSVSGSVAATLSDAYGVSGLTTLNALADVTGRAVGVYGSVRSANSASFTGTVDALYGTFAPSAGTYAAANGLEIGITGNIGSSITTPTGATLTLSPAGGVIFGASGTTTGLKIDVSGENTSGDDVVNVYGANIVATGGTTGTDRNAYGVRATATGADLNYSGYFYGALFQVDDDATVNTTNALATGAGDIYAVGDIEADGNLRVDGGTVTVRAASGNAMTDLATASATGYAIFSSIGANGAGTGGNWQNYTSGGTATVVNGAQADLRWTEDGGMGIDDEMRLTSSGELFLDTAVGVGAADVAEVYQISDMTLVAGDVVGITSDGDLVKADTAGTTNLFGVVSTTPGVTLNNGEDDEITSDERTIALIGRVPVKMNLEGGVIEAGDPITVSSTSGVAKKATGPGMILGFALESYTGSESPIEVFINLQWNPAGTITADGSAIGLTTDTMVGASSEATALDTEVDSSSLVLRGSAFDVSASDRDFSIATSVTNTTDYRLSIKNTIDAEVAYLTQDGGFSVAGDVIVGDHLYPSDRGTAQTNRYIFYDGSEGPGGDFMRTNASGWATGSYDFAEMFPSSDTLKPGDLVAFGTKKEEVVRASSDTRARLAGVVSTRPGFLAGENKAGHYPIALAGRVPTAVSGEGGEIQIGDALTISSIPGVAKKAEESGMIIGYALEAFSSQQDSGSSTGKIIAFINTTYWNGLSLSAKNTASGLGGASLSSLDLSGNLYIGSNDILNVGSISGVGMLWEISANGNLRTRGTLATTIEAYNGDLVDTYATTSPEVYVTLAGTAELTSGRVTVDLVKEDPHFLSVVSNMAPLKILASPSASVAVYTTNRKDGKFDIVQVGGSSSGVFVDWYVIGVRKDFEKEEDLIIETEVPEEPDVEETDLTPKVEEEVEIEEAVEVIGVEEVLEEEPQVEPEIVSETEIQPEPISEEEVIEEVEEVEEVVEVIEEAVAVEEVEPASDGASPESQQILSDPSHDDAGVASEGSEN